jgi:hypothetical protein
MNNLNVDEHLYEVLKSFGSKQRFSGVVTKINGTTTQIKSGDREFLAWSNPKLIVGTPVTFRIDGRRAKEIVNVEQLSQSEKGNQLCTEEPK